jgi:signal transduction histidine kinase
MSDSSNDGASRYLRTELLERIAHELRGPAGVTLGALDELEHALGAEQAEQHRLLFAMARRGAKRVLRTADRLTRTALLESATLTVHCAPTDVRTLVKQAVRDAETIEGRMSVQLRLTLPEEPCFVDVDSGWWAMAIGELVSQAIRCARREVEVLVQPRAGVVTLQVRDDRVAIVDAPAERFVSLKDRRDAALGWPLIFDVARAHRAQLTNEPLRDGNGAVTGLRVTVELRQHVEALQNATGE